MIASNTAGGAAIQQKPSAVTPKLRRVAARVQPSLAGRDVLTRHVPQTGDRAEMVAWHERASGVASGRADAAPGRAEHPLLAATDPAQSVYLVMTSISVTEAGQGTWTASRTVAVMAEPMESGADAASGNAADAAIHPGTLQKAAGSLKHQIRPNIVYSVVTTTLRLPAGAELRLAPEWLAREL